MNPITDTKARIMAELIKAGVIGALSTQLAIEIRRDKDTVGIWLKRLQDDGIVGSWPDPYLRCMTRRRWWLLEHTPQKMPLPSMIPSRLDLMPIDKQTEGLGWRSRKPVKVRRDGVLVYEPWTHDARFQVAPGTKIDGGFAALGIGRYLDGTSA